MTSNENTFNLSNILTSLYFENILDSLKKQYNSLAKRADKILSA